MIRGPVQMHYRGFEPQLSLVRTIPPRIGPGTEQLLRQSLRNELVTP
jgi:hypothetical protein